MFSGAFFVRGVLWPGSRRASRTAGASRASLPWWVAITKRSHRRYNFTIRNGDFARRFDRRVADTVAQVHT
jgi:hypothetical protein